MTSIVRADELRNRLGDGPSDLFMQEASKANINFNGTGTVAIRRSFNVSSITDSGTGSYVVNFTNAFSNANYASVTGAGNSVQFGRATPVSSGKTSSAQPMFTDIQASFVLADADSVYLSVQGDLA